MREGSDSILLTLSQQTIKDRRGGFRKILKEWYEADGEHNTWWYKSGNGPKNPENILWVYWVVKGRVRYRSRLLQVVKNKSISFNNQSEPKFGKNWFVLFDFEHIPRKFQIERKGFQGFRYFNIDEQDLFG